MPVLALALALTAQIFFTKHVICTPDYSYTTAVETWCSPTEFDPKSAYRTNLNTILDNLAQNSKIITNNGYYATNTSALGGGGTSTDSDTIYGLFLCRGDISSSDCYGCVLIATVNMPPSECPKNKGAIIWYDKCMVRYSNTSFLGTVDGSISLSLEKSEAVNNDEKLYTNLTDHTLQSLVSQLGASASSMPGDIKYFATQNATFNSSVTLYIMAQCTADLSPGNCARCLQIIIRKKPKYSMGWRVLNPSCIVRYEDYPFYELNKASPWPPSLPPSSTAPTTLAAPPIDSRGRRRKRLLYVSIPIMLIAISIALCLGFRKCVHKRKVRETFHAEMDDMTAVESLRFELSTIKSATSNFSLDNKLGEGGFGQVHKGKLDNGQEIAVKRLSKDSKQGIAEFKTEVVVVARLQHKNLVKLLGYCVTPTEKILIYEFLSKSSLDRLLFEPAKKVFLDWQTRFNIVLGIARGLEYLHEDSRLKIIHRDLKSSNILLDEGMNPKIADFGLAKLFGVDETQGDTKRIVGTYGYMAPEYALTGHYSVKSDVYSFGVILLEIVSGQRNRVFRHQCEEAMLHRAWRLWNENKVLELVDPTLSNNFPREQVIQCIHIGLLCIQENAIERPRMTPIVAALNGQSVSLSTPKAPHFFGVFDEQSLSTYTGSGAGELHYSDKSSSVSVKLGSGSGTGEIWYSNKSVTSRTALQSNLSTSR